MQIDYKLNFGAWILLLGLIVQCMAQCSANIRKDWRELTVLEQANYINAIQCLRKAPSQLSPSINSPSRFADLTYVHAMVMGNAHGSPGFFPWHRSFLNTFEKILKTECGYPGMMPYWDWSLDSQAPSQSVVFSNSSFGGSGKGTTLCLINGPFANLTTTFASAGYSLSN